MQGSYYKPSGKTPIAFFLYFLVSMAVAIPILSFVYVYLAYYIPIIYLNFIITIGCGLILGFIINWVAKQGKARSPVIVLACAFLAACALEYVQWCVYVPLIFSMVYQIDVPSFFDFLTMQENVLRGAEIINEHGVWSLSRRGSTSSGTVNGIMLSIVWVAEFIVFLTGAIMASLSQPRSPFSEEAGDWYADMDEKVGADMPESFDDLKGRMENGNFSELVQLVKARKAKMDDPQAEGDSQFLLLTFYKPPKTSTTDLHYMQVEKVTLSLDKKNNVKEDKTTLINYMSIDKQRLEEITQSA
jgi:hypothetical protein